MPIPPRVDQALHEIVALGAAGAPIGADIGSISEHALGRNSISGVAIDADHVLTALMVGGRRRDRAEISAPYCRCRRGGSPGSAIGMSASSATSSGRGHGCREELEERSSVHFHRAAREPRRVQEAHIIR